MKGKYEAALRDYKKGKFLLESRPTQLLPASRSVASNAKDPNSPSTSTQSVDVQQKRILDKVWNAVEKVMDEMKNGLLAQLKDSSKSVEEQEKTIE